MNKKPSRVEKVLDGMLEKYDGIKPPKYVRDRSDESLKRLQDFEPPKKTTKKMTAGKMWDYIKQDLSPQEKAKFRRQSKELEEDLKTKSEPVKIPKIEELLHNIPRVKAKAPDKPIEIILKEKADQKLKTEQKNYDRQFGQGGIVGLMRPRR